MSRSCERVVADIAQGLHQGFVVLRHGQVVIGVARVEIGAQAAAIEDRQRDRRRDVEEAAGRTEHRIPQQRFGPGLALRFKLG
jgi:hypothetical protein